MDQPTAPMLFFYDWMGNGIKPGEAQIVGNKTQSSNIRQAIYKINGMVLVADVLSQSGELHRSPPLALGIGGLTEPNKLDIAVLFSAPPKQFLGLLGLSCLTKLPHHWVVQCRVGGETAINVPAAVPSGASLSVAHDFTGFAFEERSFYYYFALAKREVSRNLVNAIAEKTNTEPNIRVGDTSLDDSQCGPNQDEPIRIPPGEECQGIPSNMTFGPSFFDAFAVLPNARYVIDIPMKKDNLENSKAIAKDAYQKIGAEKIVSFEIGNEPNNYGQNMDMAKYIKKWKTCCQEKANGASDLQYDLMNFTAIVRGSEFEKDAVDYLRNRTPPIPLSLAEDGSVLGNGSNNDALEAVLGSALCMTIGVNKINWQSGLTFPFALWNPTYENKNNKTFLASVHPAFYGQIFSAEFRGNADNVRISSIAHHTFLSAYAAYDNTKLRRVAIFNLQLCGRDDRPTTKVTLQIEAESSVVHIEVKKLTSPGGGTASASEITWSGMQWMAESGGKSVRVLNNTVTLRVTDGKVEIDVSASEAVIAFVRYTV
ncbi:hypothetical protein CC78DRAFT_585212 [Lojkania enalia]|uniref:Beta-glucuronidase C-terminal domain-containing protein n=1 Tax=Lojkania enalia TaxID=147567 RepID=A0A9P4JZI6_9PLEO|nr:hypothetical protein CC78DRAFT_585212 [Didymosphaeria enalia]